MRQIFQPVFQAQIFQGQERSISDKFLPLAVFKVIEGTAGLDTFAPVGAAAGKVLAQVALPAVADAKGAVDETFNLGAGGLPDGADLAQGQFPLQDQPGEAETGIEPGLLRRADSALG